MRPKPTDASVKVEIASDSTPKASQEPSHAAPPTQNAGSSSSSAPATAAPKANSLLTVDDILDANQEARRRTIAQRNASPGGMTVAQAGAVTIDSLMEGAQEARRASLARSRERDDDQVDAIDSLIDQQQQAR